MATTTCLKCLPRQSLPSTLANSFARISIKSFSTSQRVLLPMPARPKVGGRKETTKGVKQLRIKKKSIQKPTGKPPASGERKAMRKRVVLSNTNALEVVGMRDLDREMVEEMISDRQGKGAEAGGEGRESELVVQGEADNEGLVGQVVGLMGETVDSLRAVEAFKPPQGWGLFRRPGLLIREESVILSRKVVEAEKEKKALRLLVDGDRVTGKSLMLIHAMATAFVRGWIVLNISEAQDVTNAMNDYAPIPDTNPILWQQMTYTANWLQQIGKANTAILSELKLVKKHDLPIQIPNDISLARLCELGARDPDVAWPVFQAFWSEITVEGRPPLMMCLDSVSFIMQKSLYRDTENKEIHAHDLAIVRHFVDHLSGDKKLPNGGAVIAATNRSHAPISKSLELSIAQAYERQNGEALTMRDPWEKNYDERTDEVLSDVETLILGGLSKHEARGLMEYWAKSGVMRSRVDEQKVAEKWALSGGGVVGEIQRNALWMRI